MEPNGYPTITWRESSSSTDGDNPFINGDAYFLPEEEMLEELGAQAWMVARDMVGEKIDFSFAIYGSSNSQNDNSSYQEIFRGDLPPLPPPP